MSDRPESWSRRQFVGGLTLVGTAGLLGMRPEDAAAEPPPETTRLRLRRGPVGSVGTAPQFLAEELLRSEGFTDAQYPAMSREERHRALAAGEIDLDVEFVGSQIAHVDAGHPVVVIGGIHVGCFDLFAHDEIRTVRDLKGKAIGVTELGTGRHLFFASLMAHIGLDARKDVRFVVRPPAESVQLFADKKIDAYLAFGEEPHDLRDRKLGRVVLNSATDRPWSQYFCCTAAANREFVRKHPIAAKRALRAIAKATDVCALEPDRAARFLVDKQYAARYDATRRMLKDIPYQWRRFDAEDTVRFYALRLHEAGMIKSTPQKIITQGTDWRFLRELKKELKG